MRRRSGAWGSLQRGRAQTRAAEAVGARGARLHYQGQKGVQQPRPVPLQVKSGAVGQRHDGSCSRKAVVSTADLGPKGILGLGESHGGQVVPGATAGRGAHRRGRSTALRAGGRLGRRPGGSGRPGAGAVPRRSTAAPGSGEAGLSSKAEEGRPQREGRAPRGARRPETPGRHGPGRRPGGTPATPMRAPLTSALPQTQPDGSAQASGSTLSAPDPWKRRRPARDARKAARSSSRVNVCGGQAPPEPDRGQDNI